MLPSPSYFRIEPPQLCYYFLQRLTVYRTDGKSTWLVAALKCGKCLVGRERMVVEHGVVHCGWNLSRVLSLRSLRVGGAGRGAALRDHREWFATHRPNEWGALPRMRCSLNGKRWHWRVG
jgi:hypothetical protein